MFNVMSKRPYFQDGKSVVTQMVGGKPEIVPSTMRAIFTKEEWICFDTLVLRTLKSHAPLMCGLRFEGIDFSLDSLPPTVFTHEDQPTEELPKDIDPLKPVFQMQSLPIKLRLSPTMVATEKAIRETVEEYAKAIDLSLLGLCDPEIVDKVEIYGLGNCNGRFISTMPKRKPAQAWNIVGYRAAITHAINNLCQKKFYGPFAFIYPHDGKISKALAEELCAAEYLIDGMEDGRKSLLAIPTEYRHAPTNRLFLVQMTVDVLRFVVGQEPCLIQTNEGNFQLVSCIIPQIRCDYWGNCGIAEIRM